MPTNPTPAQQEASRTNGARSQGPVSEAGKERIREAATRHGLTGGFRLLPGEEELFASLRGEYWRRLRPSDAAEAAAVDKIVMALWRERRLEVIESRLALALATGAPTDGLPSLATLIRYRARIARDRRNGEEALARLRRLAGRWSQARSAPATAGPAVATAEPAGAASEATADDGSPVAVAQPSASRDEAAAAEAEAAAAPRAGAAESGPDIAAATLPEDGRRAASAEALGTATRPNAAADRAYRALLDEIGRELALLAREAGEPLPPAFSGAPGARQPGALLGEALRTPLAAHELARLEAAARRGAAFLATRATAARPASTASEAAALAARGGELIPTRSCRVACS